MAKTVVAPKMAWGFVAPRSQIAADMLPRRASPQAILGATKHQPIARHHTSPGLYACFARSSPLQKPHPCDARVIRVMIWVPYDSNFFDSSWKSEWRKSIHRPYEEHPPDRWDCADL